MASPDPGQPAGNLDDTIFAKVSATTISFAGHSSDFRADTITISAKVSRMNPIFVEYAPLNGPRRSPTGCADCLTPEVVPKYLKASNAIEDEASMMKTSSAVIANACETNVLRL